MRKLTRFFRTAVVSLACLTWILPPGAGLASHPNSPAPSRATEGVYDVRLGEDGALTGHLTDASGNQLAHQTIVLHQGGKLVAHARTDDSGEFAFARVSGGVYQISTGASTVVCRAWTSEAAPPVAGDQITMIANPPTVRGQQPFGAVFSNPLLVGLVIAAAIAIPVAIHNSQDDAS